MDDIDREKMKCGDIDSDTITISFTCGLRTDCPSPDILAPEPQTRFPPSHLSPECYPCPFPLHGAYCGRYSIDGDSRCHPLPAQESIIYEKIIPLKKNHKFLGSPKPLFLDMDDSDDSAFLRSANRTSHYRSLVIGSSIVHRLVHIPKFITDFQAKLPQDIYDTFSRDSLHVTIRSLC